MKKLIRIITTFSLIAGALYFSSCTIHQDIYSKRTVSVSGTGSVSLEADTATIILSVITRGRDVAETSAENAKKMSAVQDAVIKAGISKECISTQNYSVYQESHYDNKTGRQIPDDFRVTNQIKILVKKISTASDVIDLALKNGANQLSSLTYGVTDTELAKKQAQSLAIAQAQESANLLAGASGAKLGKVLSITEHADYSYQRSRLLKTADNIDMNFMEAEEAVATPVSGGTSTVTVSKVGS
ncbi:SIMPL domain-containing protein [Treponema sp.]|uniref:SIMPL domain-containing protein n=1 Tax=Treponema sp. TaxID=166 RepID=UPI003890D18B